MVGDKVGEKWKSERDLGRAWALGAGKAGFKFWFGFELFCVTNIP